MGPGEALPFAGPPPEVQAEPVEAEPAPKDEAPPAEASAAIVTFQVEGWTLARLDGAEEPRIQDLELAERLGYERPRAIRDLIKRLVGTPEAPGEIPDVSMRRTVRRIEMRPNVFRDAEVVEAWLTEEEALHVVMASTTAPFTRAANRANERSASRCISRRTPPHARSAPLSPPAS